MNLACVRPRAVPTGTGTLAVTATNKTSQRSTTRWPRSVSRPIGSTSTTAHRDQPGRPGLREAMAPAAAATAARAKGELRGKKPKLSPRQEAHLIELHHAGAHTSAELAELSGPASGVPGLSGSG